MTYEEVELRIYILRLRRSLQLWEQAQLRKGSSYIRLRYRLILAQIKLFTMF